MSPIFFEVPQVLLLGPILFSIFLSDLFLILRLLVMPMTIAFIKDMKTLILLLKLSERF